MTSLLKNFTLLDVLNQQVREQANLLVKNDRIVEISFGNKTGEFHERKTIDCSGCFIMPGLIDLHTHLIWSGGNDPVKVVEDEGLPLSLLRAASNAQTTVECGITCVRDLGSNENLVIELSKAITKGYLLGPRIVPSGCTVIMTGGHDPFWGIEADGEAELLKAVRTQVMKGAEVIKISATGGVYGRHEGEDVGSPELSQTEIRVVCDEAHRLGLKVAAHAISEEGIKNCIASGVDTIEHGHFLTQNMMREMNQKKMCWVPTLFVYKQIAEGRNLPTYAVEKARKIIKIHRLAFQQGLQEEIQIGCGSDAGSPNTPHGSLINELELMVSYGCGTFKALQSATLIAAQTLGLEQHYGSLDVGKKADMIILSKNPVENISNIRSIKSVMIDGNFLVPYSEKSVTNNKKSGDSLAINNLQ